MFDKIKMSTTYFEKDPMLILGKSLSFLFHNYFSYNNIKKSLVSGLLLLLYNMLCSNYFDSGSFCLWACLGCVGWEELMYLLDRRRLRSSWLWGSKSNFITKARKYFWLWNNMSLVINNVICHLAAILVFSFCTLKKSMFEFC